MKNNKLLKFLYKDIAEIEELFAEKGAKGFDKFEIDFIQSRFNGAKQLIQILEAKENGGEFAVQPHRHVQTTGQGVNAVSEEQKPLLTGTVAVNDEKMRNEEELQSLQQLSDFEEELKGEKVEVKIEAEVKPEAEVPEVANEIVVALEEELKVPEAEEQNEAREDLLIETIGEKDIREGDDIPVPDLNGQEQEAIEESVNEPLAGIVENADLELEAEEKPDEANNRLGDRFSKEKSVNELLGNTGSSKLEYKISNSPITSLTKSIGINDRYQYIRELFEGSADKFAETVGALDELNSIQEAVSYLQQKHKWKKTETSLKFVNLIKRRFSDG